MPRIRHIYIKNFRSIKELKWSPSPGINCLIGAGDAGKSTILNAIDLVLSPRHTYSFSDADFYKMDVSNPMEIWVTVGELPDELKNIDAYGEFLRGLDLTTGIFSDEPVAGGDVVLTIKLSVSGDLDPDWQLYSNRANATGTERRLKWKHKELLSSARLGATSQHHLAWGNRSILNKLSEDTLDVSATFTEISRKTRAIFSEQQPGQVDDVLKSVKDVADSLGVPVNGLQAQLDVKGLSLSAGAIALHDEDGTPLRQLGTGSTRLLISGLHEQVSVSNILLIDEAEYGLEPFRISRLLNVLGSKKEHPEKQIFLTTHSPYVLRELRSEQLMVVRPSMGEQKQHNIYHLGSGDNQQSTLRVCAEAFLSKRVVVCEGKTEIGLVRGIDLFNQENGNSSIYSNGAYCADGGGDNMFARAEVFYSLGYPVAIFKDSDKSVEHTPLVQKATQDKIPIFEWGSDFATEDAIFMLSPLETFKELIQIAIDRKGKDSIDASVRAKSNNEYGIDECLANANDTMRPVLAAASKDKSWFKDIDPAERVGKEVLSPEWGVLPAGLTNVLNAVFAFAKSN